ncbi:response regulator transcription factor [Micromonospora carbonacea]|uniref:Response regulator transcription factor n=1 Tax=Micromonospora carbonacea TaxID=47853 RepID=A0A7H8XVN6_9ACTN|nr:response regulator transcription factor [Micromonospora carbonacea]MBB5830018.1 DNA-binding NarL/FixJ family response regulator [Micromonospora carbonacea]QLD28042.1 response regulator transcription factor [Micromonospora carbonacea]
MGTEKPITAVVIDDHPAILAGVEAWLAAADPPIQVVATGSTIKAAWVPPGDSAQVVVLDLRLSTERSLAYGDLRRLVNAGRRVIVYTMLEDEQVALNCLDLGAATFLTKTEGKEHLVAATIAAAEHRPYMPPALAGAIAANARSDQPRLSSREQEVLAEWFQSESKQMVAERIGITVRTVNTYLDRVRIKYANVGRPASTKAALVARAIQDGLIEADEL